jgi:hypothetical protein
MGQRGDRSQRLDRIIRACPGLEVERWSINPGRAGRNQRCATGSRAGRPRSLTLCVTEYPARPEGPELHANQPVGRDATQMLPATTPLGQPYWLRKEGTTGLFRVDDPSLIGRPENPPAFPIEYVFEVDRQTLVISGEPMAADSGNADRRRRLDVISPVSLRFVPGVLLFAPGATG